MNGIALAAAGLGYVYPDGTRALEGVDLKVAAGEQLAIIGQNGSGKSALVRHFNGLLRPTEGEVLVDGMSARQHHVAELARLVGLAFQNPDRQIFAGRVRTEVAFGARNAGASSAELEVRVREALTAVGLQGSEDVNPYDLGYSRRKLLSLASVLAMRTPAVILDEPTTGQDARGVARVQDLVRTLGEAGRTVIAISHDMRFVAETFPRLVVMRAGRVVLDGPPAEVFGEPNWVTLASTFLEPPLSARVAARLGLAGVATEADLVAAVTRRGRASEGALSEGA